MPCHWCHAHTAVQSPKVCFSSLQFRVYVNTMTQTCTSTALYTYVQPISADWSVPRGPYLVQLVQTHTHAARGVPEGKGGARCPCRDERQLTWNTASNYPHTASISVTMSACANNPCVDGKCVPRPGSRRFPAACARELTGYVRCK